VTEPAAQPTSVRRTVTVATALVLSQAVLCGVIGWVTFGGKDPAPARPRADGTLFGPAVVVPPASVAPVTTTPPAHRAARPEKAPRHVEQPAPTRSKAGPPAEPSPVVEAASAVPEPSVTARAGSNLVRPSPAPSSSATVQIGADVGKPCAPAGAAGLTTDGVAVSCLPDRTGDLVWQIN
jgi:hypothetical protein